MRSIFFTKFLIIRAFNLLLYCSIYLLKSKSKSNSSPTYPALSSPLPSSPHNHHVPSPSTIPSNPQTQEPHPNPQALTSHPEPAQNSSTGVDYEPHPENSLPVSPERKAIVESICHLYSGSGSEGDMRVYAAKAVYDDPWSYCNTRFKIAGQWYGE